MNIFNKSKQMKLYIYLSLHDDNDYIQHVYWRFLTFKKYGFNIWNKNQIGILYLIVTEMLINITEARRMKIIVIWHAYDNIILLQYTPQPYLHTASFMSSIVQSSATAHQPPGRSVSVPFLPSPHQLMENGLPSVHFSLWCTEKVTWC